MRKKCRNDYSAFFRIQERITDGRDRATFQSRKITRAACVCVCVNSILVYYALCWYVWLFFFFSLDKIELLLHVSYGNFHILYSSKTHSNINNENRMSDASQFFFWSYEKQYRNERNDNFGLTFAYKNGKKMKKCKSTQHTCKAQWLSGLNGSLFMWICIRTDEEYLAQKNRERVNANCRGTGRKRKRGKKNTRGAINLYRNSFCDFY